MSHPIKFFQGLKVNLPPVGVNGALYHCLDTHETYLCVNDTTFELYSSVLTIDDIVKSVHAELLNWQLSGAWDGDTLTWSIENNTLIITSASGTSSSYLKGIDAVHIGVDEPIQGETIWINPNSNFSEFQIGEKGDKGANYYLTTADKKTLAEQIVLALEEPYQENYNFILANGNYLLTSDDLIFIVQESEE